MIRVVVCSWQIAIALSVQLAAQPPPGWIGTWKLNVVKSTSAVPLPYKRGTRKIVTGPDGAITIIDDLVRTRGGILHLEWTGKLDGLDYPVQGVEVVLTNAYRRVEDRIYELVQKLDGRVIATARLAISADSNVLTVVPTGSTQAATTVYDRQ